MTNDKIIFNTLHNHLEYVTSHLGIAEDRIIGIFLYGSQNYGTSTPTSDVDSKVIVLPSFEDFCLRHNSLYSKEVILENGEHIDVKDIRIYRENLFKQNINYVETLFTKYCIVNPKYEMLFNNYFIKNREFIARYDRRKGVLSTSHQAIHTLSQGLEDDKKLYNGHRLMMFLHDYIKDDIPYEECICPKGEKHNILMRMKAGTYDYGCPKAEENKKLQKELQDFGDKYKSIDSPFKEAGLKAVDQGTVELLKYSFRKQKEEEISQKDFFSKLTNAETKAYYSIVRQIHEEGNVTISKLVEANSISRPVYNNLLTKMKEYKVAEILNMGAKGTYIRITQTELKAEAMNYN